MMPGLTERCIGSAGDAGNPGAGPRIVLTCETTTSRVLRRPISRTITFVLRRRLRGFCFDLEGVETALHEAIVNAAVHGNLGIASPAGGASTPFHALAPIAAARLAGGPLSARRIMIMALQQGLALHVHVADEGGGFDPSAQPEAGTGQPHGRGLRLIAAYAEQVEHRRGGREIRMMFALRRRPGVSVTAP